METLGPPVLKTEQTLLISPLSTCHMGNTTDGHKISVTKTYTLYLKTSKPFPHHRQYSLHKIFTCIILEIFGNHLSASQYHMQDIPYLLLIYITLISAHMTDPTEDVDLKDKMVQV
jgi:hypothetical protein